MTSNPKVCVRDYSTRHHVRALMKKNWIIKRRHYITTLAEILFPLIFIIAFSFVKKQGTVISVPSGWSTSQTITTNASEGTAFNVYGTAASSRGMSTGELAGRNKSNIGINSVIVNTVGGSNATGSNDNSGDKGGSSGNPSSTPLNYFSSSPFVPRYYTQETSMSSLLLALTSQSIVTNTGLSAMLSPDDLFLCIVKTSVLGHVRTSDPSDPFYVASECRDLVIPYKIAIVPNNSWTQYFYATIKQWYPRVPLSTNKIASNNESVLTIPSVEDSFTFFDSEADLEAYCTADAYGQSVSSPRIYAAIVFREMPAAPGASGSLDYVLRFNATRQRRAQPAVPRTIGTPPALDPFQKSMDTTNYKLYSTMGFATLQTLVARFMNCQPSPKNVSQCQHPVASLTPDLRSRLQHSLATDTVLLTAFDQVSKLKNLTNLYAASDAATTTKGTRSSGMMSSIKAVTMANIPISSWDVLLTPLQIPPQPFFGTPIGFLPFPMTEYISAPFYTAIASYFPLGFILSYLYVLSKVLVLLVLEKESRSRELMKILGVHESSIVLSWYCTYTLLLLVASIFQGIASTVLLFPHSNLLLLILFFFLFGLSVLAFAFCISAIFSRARTASYVGMVLFFLMYFISQSFTTLATEAHYTGACLLPPVALALTIRTLAAMESVSSGLTFGNGHMLFNGFRFQTGISMLFLDFLLYTLLGMYLELIVPKEYGTTLKWYEPFMPSFWQCRSIHEQPAQQKKASLTAAKVRDATSRVIDDARHAFIEPVSGDLLLQEQDGRALLVRGLCKEFKSTSGTVKHAVTNVDLNLYENQVTCLLGHNGAGKTTLISILTGMLPLTSGDATLGALCISRKKDMTTLRQSIGFCPQHDVLYAELTVEEHLQFYAAVKGYVGAALEEVVSKKIQEVGLTEKRFVQSFALSGGMKRKLSVAIALLGDSKLVFLDEPTSGMDPYSRRSTWELIMNNRQKRIVVLTTHFMDEADILGDRIAIMADGELRCVGSSLFLKRKYGAGYNLTLVKNTSTDGNGATVSHLDKTLVDFIQSYVPSANILSRAGAEMVFQLPSDASGQFPLLFQMLEEKIKNTTFGVASFGIGVTTMEQVFLKVASMRSDGPQQKTPLPLDIHANKKDTQNDTTVTTTTSQGYTLDVAKVRQRSLFSMHVYATLVKRFLTTSRDIKIAFFSTILPIALMSIGFALLRSAAKYQDDSAQVLDTSFYDLGDASPVTYLCAATMNTDVAERNMMMDDDDWCYRTMETYFTQGAPMAVTNFQPYTTTTPTVFNVPYISPEIEPENATGLSLGLAEVLFHQGYGRSNSVIVPGQYGAYVMYANSASHVMAYNVLFNTSSLHSSVLYKNLLDQAIYRSLVNQSNVSFKITTHPLPLSAATKNLYNSQISLIGIFFIIIAMTFYPAAIVPFIVKEKQTHAKHQQLVSGLNVFAFWIANYMWDMALYMVPVALTMGLLAWFDMTILIGGPDCDTCGPRTFEATFWLFLLYGISICPLSYVLSHGFHEHASAQFYILVLNFVFGLFLILLSITLDTFIDPTMSIDPATINFYLKYLYRLSPMFNLGNGLVNLSRVSNITTDVFHVNITGLELSYMGGEAGGFFVLAVAVDVYLSLPKLRNMFRRVPKPKTLAPGSSSATTLDHVPVIIDQDVQEEADRVVDPTHVSQHVVALSQLRKVYPGGKVAVDGLSFGLTRGECFGFLGINGAGKTTTLKMLTGDLLPTSGHATLLGGSFDLLTQQRRVRPFIGYCPQFDALFELLTVREHLELYARIKGIPRSAIDAAVLEKLTTLQLKPFETKLAGTLSGGNKRKLSVAIAMIGTPPVMFLDEPSTGMDPTSRRFLWDVLANVSTVKKESTIVLTTHAMEECEALSSRVGIMVGGALRCIGPIQHLKNRFGHGWTLEVKLEMPTQGEIYAFAEHLTSIMSATKNDDMLPRPSNQDNVLHHHRCGVVESHQLRALCTRLGNENRFHGCKSMSRDGYTIATAAIATNHHDHHSVPISIFAAWWVSEDRFDVLQRFLDTAFGAIHVQFLEKQNDLMTFKLSPSILLSHVFQVMESAKKEVGIMTHEGSDRMAYRVREYSVAQTSLEQIFNRFASQQHEERRAATRLD